MAPPLQKYQATDDRRRAIASAARSLIVEKGFEGLRTREIADRVGINIATLHYHVPSKDALIELVALSLREELREQHLASPREHLPPLEQLKVEIRQFRENREQNPDLFEVMDELHRRSKRDENVAKYMTPMRAFWLKQIADILQAGVDDGTFRSDLDAQSGAYLVIGAMIMTATRKFSGKDMLPDVIEEILRAFLSPKSKGLDNV